MSEQMPTTTQPTAEVAAPAFPSTSEEGFAILPAQYWVNLGEPDVGVDDSQSSLSDDDRDTTASLTASILDYRTINGRTYHSSRGDAEYWGANDEAQNEALDIIHHDQTLLLDGEFCKAPIGDDVQKVLDVGTGTGLWAIDFGGKYTKAEVIGTDISPIQLGWVPPNVTFQIDDCTQEWTFAENSLDFVHMRWLFGSIKDWDALYQQAYRALKPGGWIESHEPSVQFQSDNGSVHGKTAMGQFGKFFVEGGKKMGRSMTVVEDGVQHKGIEDAGFININEQSFKTPFGNWRKDPKLKTIGSYQHLATANDTEGSMLYMAGSLGWSAEEVRVYVAHLRREFCSPDIHAYYTQKIVWAQKPE